MYSGECPVSLFLELEMLVRKHTPYAQRHALSVAAEILALAGGTDDAFPPEEGLVKRFLRLARESMRDPGVTVELLARKLGVHRTTLTALFRAEMEITPGAYLDNLRLLHALSLLREKSPGYSRLQAGLQFLISANRAYVGASSDWEDPLRKLLSEADRLVDQYLHDDKKEEKS